MSTYEWQNGDMSNSRYGLNLTGVGASMYATYAYGGPSGILVGTAFYVGDMFYHSAEVSAEQRRQASEQSRFRIHTKNIFSKDFWLEIGGFFNMSGMSGINY